MTNPWFRFYSEFSHDPKVQMMSEAMQRRYIMVMCLRCSNDLVTLHETEIAFHLRISDAELADTKALFISKGFIDDQWNLVNWDKRQYKSDSSAERVARHRKTKKESSNVDVTLQKQKSNALDTDTDTDKETEESKALADKPPKQSRKHRLPDDFVPNDAHRDSASKKSLDLQAEFEQFKFHHRSKGSTMVDWSDALHTWLGNAVKFKPRSGAPPNRDSARHAAAKSIFKDEHIQHLMGGKQNEPSIDAEFTRVD